MALAGINLSSQTRACPKVCVTITKKNSLNQTTASLRSNRGFSPRITFHPAICFILFSTFSLEHPDPSHILNAVSQSWSWIRHKKFSQSWTPCSYLLYRSFGLVSTLFPPGARSSFRWVPGRCGNARRLVSHAIDDDPKDMPHSQPHPFTWSPCPSDWFFYTSSGFYIHKLSVSVSSTIHVAQSVTVCIFIVFSKNRSRTSARTRTSAISVAMAVLTFGGTAILLMVIQVSWSTALITILQGVPPK